jgi:energy-coupling factor transporter ATP-binding protein EcfA2
MLTSLNIRNLTVFSEADFTFSPQLNVFVGENGTGKTHVLKAAYSALAVSVEMGQRSPDATTSAVAFSLRLADKFAGVFRPDSIAHLIRRGVHKKHSPCQLTFNFDNEELGFRIRVGAPVPSAFAVSEMPTAWLQKPPVFIPTRELLSIYPGFVSLYESYHLKFEETWRDTCLRLGAPLVRLQKQPKTADLLAPIEKAMGGTIELDEKSGQFYLDTPGVGKIEISLVAEGLRKLAMLARLIGTGWLVDRGHLFWDEPEANLNPKLIREVASVILHLCSSGIQIFIATHSLFLIRELYILLEGKEFKHLKPQFFGLHLDENGVSVCQGPTVDDIGDISSLDEEISQSDRYLDVEASAHDDDR